MEEGKFYGSWIYSILDLNIDEDQFFDSDVTSEENCESMEANQQRVKEILDLELKKHNYFLVGL